MNISNVPGLKFLSLFWDDLFDVLRLPVVDEVATFKADSLNREPNPMKDVMVIRIDDETYRRRLREDCRQPQRICLALDGSRYRPQR